MSRCILKQVIDCYDFFNASGCRFNGYTEEGLRIWADRLEYYLVEDYDDESDYDFYIVINDGENVGEASDQAYKAIRFVQNRPVDIVIGTTSRFDRVGRSAGTLQIEGEVARKGVLLYDRDETQMAEVVKNIF